jgi:hypothetical protein
MKPKLWKALLMATLALNVIEGALRKWFFPGSGQLLYFAKDAVLIGAYVSFMLAGPHEANQRTKTATMLCLLAGTIIFLDAFNPNIGSVIVGFFGIKCYLLYVGLIYLGARLFKDWKQFQTFVQWQVAFAIFVCLLGIVQFGSPADAQINRYAVGDEQILTFGTDATVRITGTFAFISGHVSFLFVSTALTLGLICTSDQRKDKFLGPAALILCAGNMLMSGSRAGGIMLLAMVALVLIWFAPAANRVASRVRTVLLISVALALLAASLWFGKAYSAYLERIESSDDEFVDRAFQYHDVFGQILDYAGLTGFGTGLTHPGSAALEQGLGLKPSEPVPILEAEYARVLIELGWIGALLWYSFRIAVLFGIWKVYRELRSAELKCWAFVILLVHLFSLNGAVVLNHTFAIYYWLLAGIAFGLPQLERSVTDTELFSRRNSVWTQQTITSRTAVSTT